MGSTAPWGRGRSSSRRAASRTRRNDDGHFDISRTFYRARRAAFVEFEEESYTVEVGAERERWPELADAPFRSCSGA